MQTAKRSAPATWRWAVLIAVSLALLGNYYAYDWIGPVADLLQRELGFSDTQLGTLNAIYSLPNVVMVLIGGILIDRFGTRLATVAFATICALGAALLSLSGFVFAAALRARERGPQGHGLETIRAGAPV